MALITTPISEAAANSNLTLVASSTNISPGSDVNLTATLPVTAAGETQQTLTQEFDSTRLRLDSLSDIRAPQGWQLSFSTNGQNFTTTAPTTSAGWAALSAVRAQGSLISDGIDSGRQVAATTTSAGTRTATANGFTSSTGGDGWQAFFDHARSRVFTVYHSAAPNNVIDCWLISTGDRCAGFPYQFGEPQLGQTFARVVGTNIWTYGRDGLRCVDISGVLTNTSNSTASGTAPIPCSTPKVTLATGRWFMNFAGASTDGNTGETRLYTIDKMSNPQTLYCVDTATKAQCSDFAPLALNGVASAPNDSGSEWTTPQLSLWQNRLYISTRVGTTPTPLVTCINLSTRGLCQGWTANFTSSVVVSNAHFLMQLPNSSSQIVSVCAVPVTQDSSVTDFPCWGATASRSNLLTLGFPRYANTRLALYGANPETRGTRVYFGNADFSSGGNSSTIWCWDLAANSGAGGNCIGGATNVPVATWMRNYTVTPDPLLPNCIWVTQHNQPVVQAYNLVRGDFGCADLSPQTVTLAGATSVPRMGCSGTNAISSWRTFELTSVSGSTPSGITLSVLSSQGASLTGLSRIPVTVGQPIDLSSLSVSTSGQAPLFALEITGGTASRTVSAKVTAVGDAPQLCLTPTAVTICPATLGPVYALASGTAAVTASGIVGGTTLNQAGSTINISAPVQSQCGSTLSGRGGDATLGSSGNPAPGSVVTLLNSSGSAVTYPSDWPDAPLRGLPITTSTSVDGTYSFGHLTPGTYRVSFAQPAGFTIQSATVASGSTGSSLTTVNASGIRATSSNVALAIGTAGVVNSLFVRLPITNPDTSIGPPGVLQWGYVLDNDLPSSGQSIGPAGGVRNLSLCFLGTNTSCGANTIDVPGQGQYYLNTVQLSTAMYVAFQPCASPGIPIASCTGVYSGTVSPIAYRIVDTAGRAATNTYSPVIVPPPTAGANSSAGAWNAPQLVAANTLLSNDTSSPLTTLNTTSIRVCLAGTAPASCTGTSLTVANQGTYTVNTSTGALTFTPLSTFAGQATPIQYRVADALGSFATASFTATVTPPASPSASNELKLVQPGSSVSFTTVTGAGGLGTSGGPAFVTTATTAGTGLCPLGSVLPASLSACTSVSVFVPNQGTFTLDRATGVVTYTALSGTAQGTKTAVTYVVRDGVSVSGRANWASGTLTPVVPGPPAANDDTSFGAWDTDQSIHVLNNDVASTGTSINVSSVRICASTVADSSCSATSLTIPNQGTYTVNTSSGVVSFNPLPGMIGSATPIKYVVNGSDGLRDSATISVTVAPPSPPTATSESKTVLPGATIEFTTLDRPGGLATQGQPPLVPASSCLIIPNSSPATCDADGVVTIAGEGTFSLNTNSGIVSYTAALNATAGNKTAIQYRVVDAFGNSASSTLRPVVPASPSSNPDTSRGEVNNIQTVAPTGNDSPGETAVPLVPTSIKICPKTSPQTVCTSTTSVVISGKGTFSINPDGTIKFEPLPDVAGISEVAYTVEDSQGRATTNLVTVTVLPKPAPSAKTDTRTGDFGLPITFSPLSGTLNSAQADSPGTLPPDIASTPSGSRTGSGEVTTVESVQNLAFGQLRLCAANESVPSCTQQVVTTVDGTYSISGTAVVFTPAPGFIGQATTPVQYQISNSFNRVTTTTTITETTANPSGSCSGSCSFVQINDSTGKIPTDAGYVPTWRTTTTSVSSAQGTPEVASAYLIPTVNNPAPIVADNESASAPWNTSISENVTIGDSSGAGLVISSIRLCGANDVAPNCTQYSVYVSGQGVYSANTSSGVVTFTPAEEFSGTATPITYSIRDGLNRKASATFTPTIGAPVPPSASSESKFVLPGNTINFSTIAESGPLTSPGIAGSLIDGAACLLATGTSTCDSDGIVTTNHGVFELNPLTGVVSYTANQNAPAGPHAAVSYRVIDALGLSASATLNPQGYQRPTAAPKSGTDLVGTIQTFSALAGATHHSGQPVTAASVRLCVSGDAAPVCSGVSLTIAAQGTYTVDNNTGVIAFTPDAGFVGTVTPATFSITDGLGQFAASTISPVVTPLPQMVASNDSISGVVGTDLVFQPTSNDSAGSGNSSGIAALSIDLSTLRLCDV
ncbi:MAG: tandem-95 repeat protein, partial [Actinobacteria bacterium]|nr:tandem-95 repeat protein [Actinomycetota bacterium]